MQSEGRNTLQRQKAKAPDTEAEGERERGSREGGHDHVCCPLLSSYLTSFSLDVERALDVLDPGSTLLARPRSLTSGMMMTVAYATLPD